MEKASSVGCGHGETGKTEKDLSLFMSAPKLEVRLHEYGLGPPEDWACLSSNTGRNCCQTEEEGREKPVVSTQSLSLCDKSEGAQSQAEGESVIVEILPIAACGKQAEEADRGEAVIWEGQEATKEKETSEQEAENSTVGGKEEETKCESADLITPSGDPKVSVMGQSSSSEGSDSETKEYFQEGECVGKEEMKLSLELCDSLSIGEGLKDPVSTPGDVPNPSLIVCGDAIEGPESAVPHLLIESLHEGEPPPDINSLEQNQETAVRDYGIEQQWGLAPETGLHSGNCTERANVKELGGEHLTEPCGYNTECLSLMDKPDNTADCQTDDKSTGGLGTDPTPDMMPNVSCSHADLDSGMTHGLSSDDDCSFQSVGSSTTEIFHPTQDNVSMEDQDFLETRMAEGDSLLKVEEPNNSKPVKEKDHSPAEDAGISFETGSVSALTATDCIQSKSQLSPSLRTMEAFSIKGSGEELDPEPSKQNLLLSLQSGDAPMVGADESESRQANDSDLNAGVEHLESEVTVQASYEASPFNAENCEVVDPGVGDHQFAETSDKPAVDSAGKNGDMQLPQLQEPKQDISDVTADEEQPDEGLKPSDNQSDVAATQGITSHSDNADDKALEVEPPSPNDDTSSGPPVDDQMTENADTVDEASPSAIQGRQTLITSSPRSHLATCSVSNVTLLLFVVLHPFMMYCSCWACFYFCIVGDHFLSED